MESRRTEQLYYLTIYIVTILAAGLGIIFYSGLALENWAILVTLALLLVYLQTIVVRISERMDYSLATAAVFPVIYLCGTTPAMIINGLAGLADGVFNKKEWRRTLFNVSQLAICAFVGSQVHGYLNGTIGGNGLGMVVAMLAGTLGYIFTNVALVSLVVALWRGVSWWPQLRLLAGRSLYSSFSSGFIGVIFTLFVMSYGLWGIVGFGALLVMLTELLKAAVEVSSERARRKELEEELVIDEMTDALNFRFLNKWLSETLDEEPVSVLFCDIDDFAVFNNNYGHAAGDKVLKLFVETINQNVRAEDKVIRYGGDEFVVLLQGMSSAGASRVAERIMGHLRSLRDAALDEPITVSIGVASLPEDTKDKHQLLLFADQAMYAAKDAGKDTICLWSCAVSAVAATTDPC
ncbi:MAG: GGDEF domain-containing protein [Firmicutes bacterium]|nr:GGDEF domain-containing protein [Bacillota bacterium]